MGKRRGRGRDGGETMCSQDALTDVSIGGKGYGKAKGKGWRGDNVQSRCTH